MIIATFGPTTGWSGKTIDYDNGLFTLEAHGPITPADVMEYDRQGHLIWANEGTRAWVDSQAMPSVLSRADADDNVATGDLVDAWGLFMDGKSDKALAILRRVVRDGLADTAQAQEAAKLASRIRQKDDERLNNDCDELIAVAQAEIGRHGVLIGRAKYLGGHFELGSPRDGILEVTAKCVDLVWKNSGRPLHKRLPMSSITSIGVHGGQVAQPFLAFDIIDALPAKGSKDRTFLSVSTRSGEIAVYEVDSKSPGEVRAAIAPVLRVAGVPFDDQRPQDVRQIVSSDDAPLGSAADEIAKLGELRAKGLLTDEEFEAAKQKILGAL